MEQLSFFTKHKRTMFGVAVGAVAGFMYWRFIGCSSGHCPISSNPFISTGYGSMLGYLFVGLIRKEKSEVK